MLSIYSIKNSKEAGRYYEQDNYYTKGSLESIAATHWWGKGAEILGLSDYVDPRKFVELLEGKIDQNTQLGRKRNDGGVEHKPGYDLTFSAPKSVSMLAEIGGDQRILEAHNNAVNETLKYFESRVAKYRKTEDSITTIEQTDNLIVAKYRHDTSRSVDGQIDCQVHTHCVVMNAVLSKEGEWKSLHERSIFDYKMVGGMIYRSALAIELKQLGYEIEKTREDGLFEIKGFTRDQIETFSRRRVKILDVMKENGLSGAEDAQAICYFLREEKIEVDRGKLRQEWRDRADEIGLNLNEIIETSQAKKFVLKDTDFREVADRSLSYAIEHCLERESVFDEKELIKKSLHYGLGFNNVAHIQESISRFMEEGRLIYLGAHGHKILFTSPKVLEQEKEIVELMKGGRGEVGSIGSPEVVELYLEALKISDGSGLTLTKSQRSSLDFLMGSTDRVVGIQGYAGTGKTTMLHAFTRMAEEAGYSIRGAAPSAAASGVLRNEIGTETDTLAFLLMELEKEALAVSSEEKTDISKEPQEKKPEILLIDESSMVSTKQMLDLLKYAEALDKRVILVGDCKQLGAVERGNPFLLLQKSEMACGVLTVIIRQKAADIAFAVKETVFGNVKRAVEAIGHPSFLEQINESYVLAHPRSAVIEIKNKEDRLSEIARYFLSKNPEERGNTLVLLGSNKDRVFVNDLIRRGLKTEGRIFGEEASSIVYVNKGMTLAERSHVSNYKIGDVVRFNKPYRSLGIEKFDYLEVVGLNRDSNELFFKKSGKDIRWNPEGFSKGKGAAIDVYRKEARSLSTGDEIRWTQNNKAYEIYNTESAKVIGVHGNHVTVTLRNGKRYEMDISSPLGQHWDYAWSSTIYGAQGKKANEIIGMLESGNKNLTNFSSFYVMISRAVHGVKLFVDDLDKVIKTIEKHSGEKSNATGFLIAQKEKIEYEGYLKSVNQKLGQNIHEEKNEFIRLSLCAKDYAQREERENTLLVVPDFQNRQKINSLVRDNLKLKGELGKEELTASALRSFHIVPSEEKQSLRVGMLIKFDRGYRKAGITKGSYLVVSDFNSLTNEATLKSHHDEPGIKVGLDFLAKQQGDGLSIYKKDSLSLSVGDEIIWTRSFKESGIVEREVARVQSIDIQKNMVNVELQKGGVLNISLSDERSLHWKYAYAREVQDQEPRPYSHGILLLDSKTKSGGKIAASMGLMGKAKQSATLYTHSQDYVARQYQALTGNVLEEVVKSSENKVRRDYLEALTEFHEGKKACGQAWITYYQDKKMGVDAKESLSNAQMLDVAQAELAHKIVNDEEHLAYSLQSLGLNERLIQKYADKKEKEDNRKLQKVVNSYLSYSKQARSLWKNLYKASDRGERPHRESFEFAKHVSELRNKLALEITEHPEKYSQPLDRLSQRTRDLMETHSQQFKKSIEDKITKERVLDTQDWRMTLKAEQSEKTLSPVSLELSKNLKNSKVEKRAYFDKEQVLNYALGQAEEILSELLSEQKNSRLSKGDKLVFGKKHGSVHCHLSGPKAGLVNDFERGIHDDLISYYSKYRGIPWQEGLSELASRVGIAPEIELQTRAKPVISQADLDKKQKASEEEIQRKSAMKSLAQKTWSESKPIEGTLAETYLRKHRKIQGDCSRIEARYHEFAPNTLQFDGGQVKVKDKHPAMVVAFKNSEDEVTAIQCTYLKKETGNKDKSVKVPKKTMGQLSGSAGVIYQGGNHSVIVGEGAETAASLISTNPLASIYITGGNMQNVGKLGFLAKNHFTDEILIAADNDLSKEAPSWLATQKGVELLAKEGVRSLVAQPEVIEDQKTDFNDVAKKFGEKEVRRQFDQGIASGREIAIQQKESAVNSPSPLSLEV